MQQLKSLVIALVSALLVWSLSAFTGLGVLGRWAYDALVDLGSGLHRPQAEVLLLPIEATQAQGAPLDWPALFAEIQAHAPRQIILLGLSTARLQRAVAAASDYPNVLVGLTREQLPANGAGAAAVAAENVAIGVVSYWPKPDGVHRFAPWRLAQAGEAGAVSILQAATAQQAAAGQALPRRQRFLVDFTAGTAWLPRLAVERVLAGELIPALVSGRSVIIGPAQPSWLPRLQVPAHTLAQGVSEQGLSALEFHGYALASLQQQRWIQRLPAWAVLVLLTLVAALNLAVYQLLGIRAQTVFSAGMIGGYVLLGWGLLHGLRLWWPLTDFILLQLLTFAWLLRERWVAEETAVNQAVSSVSARLLERYVPTRFYASPEYWSQLVNLVDQTLDLTRFIFLEPVANDHRVREVQAIRCSLADIDERRRDYERTPYSSAIEAGEAIELTGARPYLRPMSELTERQFLAPLLFAGRVQGFWAFGIDTAKAEPHEHFFRTLRDFSAQLAELLFHRQQWRDQQALQQNPWRRYLRLEAGQSLFGGIRHYLGTLEQRLTTLESVIHGLDVATIHYDLFGRVQQLNRPMTELLQAAALPVYELTALDLLVKLSAYEPPQARQALNQVILERAGITLEAQVGHSERDYVLVLRPLLAEAAPTTPSPANEAVPFALRGLLFQLIDITQVKHLCEMKTDVIKRLDLQLRNDLEVFSLADRLLSRHGMPAAQRQSIQETLHKRIQEMMQRLQETEQYVFTEMDLTFAAAYPVDGLAPLQAALSETEAAAGQRQLVMTRQQPDFMSLVLAQPTELQALLAAIVTLCIEDSPRHSRVQITVRERAGWAEYELNNAGFGLPNEQLQHSLNAPAAERDARFDPIVQGLQRVTSWGGQYTAESALGEGMRFVIWLQVFGAHD